MEAKLRSTMAVQAEHADRASKPAATKILLVYAKLKELLMTNTFRPNEQINLNEIATKLSVSQTPVREALIRLSDEGLVRIFPNRGYFTKPLDFQEQADLLELAFAIMEHTISTAVSFKPINEREVLKLFAQRNFIDPVTSIVNGASAIEHVYETVTSLGGNLQMLRTVRNALDRTHSIRQLEMEETGTRTLALDDLLGLVNEVHAGNREGAIVNIHLQLRHKLESLLELVKEGNSRSLSADLP
jgi:DNA-binding GntR family transcriptional regulator